MTDLAHSPQSMHQTRVYNPCCIKREDRFKGNRVRHLRVLPDGKRVDLIANQVDFVSLTEFHESNENFSGIAAALEIIRSITERYARTEPPSGLFGEQRNKAFVGTPSFCA